MYTVNDHLDQLERFHLAITYGAKLPPEDVDYIFELLKTGNVLLARACGFILVQLPRYYLLRLLKTFPQLTYKVRKTLIPYLVTTTCVDVYSFLLDLLVTTRNKDLLHILIISLAKSEYMLFPLILVRMHTSSRQGLINIEFLLERMGFEKCEPYLAALPYIPHENTFRKVFGDVLIDRVKR